MIGGMIWPPVDAIALVAPAKCGLKPAFFMIGIVNEPEANGVGHRPAPGEIMPCRPEAATAAFAGPPVKRPVSRKARSLKSAPMFVRMSTTANSRNRKMKVEETWIGVPKIPAREVKKVPTA